MFSQPSEGNYLAQLPDILSKWYAMYTFSSANQLRRDLTPFAKGIVSGELVISPTYNLYGNEFSRIVLKSMEIQAAQQFRPSLWLKSIETYGRNMEINDFILHVFNDSCMHVTYFPRIEFNPEGSHARIIWCGVNEFATIKRCMIAQDLALELLQIIALGGPFDYVTLSSVCDCSNMDDYIASRLFQGVLDPYFGPNLQTSNFLTESLSTYETNEFDTFINTYTASVPFEEDATFQSILRSQAQTMQGNVVLNNDTELLSALTQLVPFDSHYARYVSQASPSGQVKIGERPFLRIIHGKQKKYRAFKQPLSLTARPENENEDFEQIMMDSDKPLQPKFNYLQELRLMNKMAKAAVHLQGNPSTNTHVRNTPQSIQTQLLSHAV